MAMNATSPGLCPAGDGSATTALRSVATVERVDMPPLHL
jgi:hypothetical protein